MSSSVIAGCWKHANCLRSVDVATNSCEYRRLRSDAINDKLCSLSLNSPHGTDHVRRYGIVFYGTE